MKIVFLVAALAATTPSTGALAQFTPGSTTDTGSMPAAGSAPATPAPAPSPSTGSNTGSGSTEGSGASATPGNQSPNPNVHGGTQGNSPPSAAPWSGGGWTGSQPMMQGMMTCISPAPGGGFGSFACYPAGWGGMMGMDMTGWHPRMRHSGGDQDYWPTPYDQDRQSHRRWRDRTRNDGGGYGNDGPEDFMNE